MLIVTDIRQRDIPALSGAYARLIEAAGGGTLGLFTAIARLRAVHSRIADRLAMVPIEDAPLGTGLVVETPDGPRDARVVEKPFLDPRKHTPKA